MLPIKKKPSVWTCVCFVTALWITMTESLCWRWYCSCCFGILGQQIMPEESNFVIMFIWLIWLTDVSQSLLCQIKTNVVAWQWLAYPAFIMTGNWKRTSDGTHWWLAVDSIKSVYAKVDTVSINRIKDGDNKPPSSNSPEIVCPFSQYQVAASSCHRVEGKENRCQSCTSSALLQWLFVGVALLPPGQPPAAHSLVSRGSPTVCPAHKAALSFAPHWHALIVMCSGEWWCSSTTFKGNWVPGWVAKVWLPGYGIQDRKSVV